MGCGPAGRWPGLGRSAWWFRPLALVMPCQGQAHARGEPPPVAYLRRLWLLVQCARRLQRRDVGGAIRLQRADGRRLEAERDGLEVQGPVRTGSGDAASNGGGVPLPAFSG